MFGLRLNENIAQILFSLESGDFHTTEQQIIEEAVIAMTPRSLKVLSIILQNALNALESAQGPISLGPGKEEELNSKLIIAMQNQKSE
jgi:hypothetical protein